MKTLRQAIIFWLGIAAMFAAIGLLTLLVAPAWPADGDKPKPLSAEDRDAYQAILWRLVSTGQEIESLLAPCRQNTVTLQGTQKQLSDEITLKVQELRKKYGVADTCALTTKGEWACPEKKEEAKQK